MRADVRQVQDSAWAGWTWRLRSQVMNGILELDTYDELSFATTRYGYTLLDQLTDVWDAASNHTLLSYDKLGRKTGMSDPDMGGWSYSYDAVGNLQRQTDALGKRICLYYDLLNRLTGKHYRTDDACPTANPPLNVSYSYDQGSYGKG